MSDFGRLRKRRNELGLSLRDVEASTKKRVSNAYVSQLETGKISNPSIGVAVELAAVYGVPIGEFIAWLTDPPSPKIAACKACGRPLSRASSQEPRA